MAYGSVKVDTIIFDQGGTDQNVTASGIYRAITSGVTVTGTISGAVLIGTTTVSGATVTGTAVQGTTVQGVSGTFTSLTGTTTTGTTANFVSGVFTTRISGTTVTGDTGQFTSGTFVSLTGTTITGTTINAVTVSSTTGTFTSLTGTTITGTTINGVTVAATTGSFTSLTGTTIQGTTATYTTGSFTSLTGTTIQGTTATYTTGSFTSLTGTTTTGTTANFASGVFTTSVSGTTVIASTGTFTSLTGTTTQGTTATYTTGSFTSLTGTTTTGTTSSFTSGVFTTLSGATATFTSGIIASGTAAAPSLAILGDPNTGIYSPGADQLAVATNGTARLFVNSSGLVGIGTTSPATTLDVNGNVTITDKIIHGGGTNTAIRFPAADTVSVETAGSERARIDSSGRLLVGTYSALSNLSYEATSNLSPQIQLIGSTASTAHLGIVRTSGAGPSDLTLGWGSSDNLAASNQDIGAVLFSAFDGSVYRNAAYIQCEADGTHAAGDTPGRLVFSTTADGAATPTERLRIKSDGESYFQANNTTSAVTINQTGTGNALVVEDNTNPDATPFVIDQNGRTVQGHTVALSLNGTGGTPTCQLHAPASTLFAGACYSAVSWSDAAAAPGIFLAKARADAVGTYTAVPNNQNLGEIRFAGADGSQFQLAASIRVEADGTPSTGIVPGRIFFQTANSSGTLTEAMRITSTGAVLVGATAAPTDVADGDIALQNRLVMNAATSNYGQFQRIADTGSNITATTGTIVFKFKSALISSNRSAFVKINLSGRSNNATPSNSPACEYAFQLHQTSAGVCTINGTTTIFEYTFVRATHFAFANLGSGECTVTLTNPTGQSITPAYMVEINTQAGVFGLDTVTIT
jgi:hypothetical protein